MSMERSDNTSTRQPKKKRKDRSVWRDLISGGIVFVAVAGVIGTIGTMRLGPMDQKLLELADANKDLNVKMTPLLTMYAQQTSNLAASAAQNESNNKIFDRMQKEIESKVDSKLFDADANAATARFVQNNDAMTKALAEQLVQLHDLENEIVKRSDNDQRQASINLTLANLENRINALQLLVESRLNQGVPQPLQIQGMPKN